MKPKPTVALVESGDTAPAGVAEPASGASRPTEKKPRKNARAKKVTAALWTTTPRTAEGSQQPQLGVHPLNQGLLYEIPRGHSHYHPQAFPQDGVPDSVAYGGPHGGYQDFSQGAYRGTSMNVSPDIPQTYWQTPIVPGMSVSISPLDLELELTFLL